MKATNVFNVKLYTRTKIAHRGRKTPNNNTIRKQRMSYKNTKTGRKRRLINTGRNKFRKHARIQNAEETKRSDIQGFAGLSIESLTAALESAALITAATPA